MLNKYSKRTYLPELLKLGTGNMKAWQGRIVGVGGLEVVKLCYASVSLALDSQRIEEGGFH